MNAPGLFPAGAHWFGGAHLARVVSVQDPQNLGRVQIRLLGADPDEDAPIWARVAVAFAGNNYGAFFIPDVDTEVLVVFNSNDPDYPIVIGSLWNGSTTLPESLSGDAVDRWTVTGKNGTRIAIVEQGAGQETVEITTPNGATAKLTDSSGGEITLKVAGNEIKMSSSGVTVQATATCKVSAPTVKVSASMVQVDAPFTKFNGVVQCNFLVATGVISQLYTPGAGNVW
jgi:uncharacterized protein involved in type VI secretion and phage assembly